ncbi:hypothetical protein [Chryseobacterium gambrini]|uniref:hypothetical protein n=1 Tax=Chryseobacterium gambrini TaxID=373672 RepID=UPI0022F3E6F8|nr:hypothetical protein [Chryseobacterium gambrini]WBX98245.1 hypothetical protein PE065_03070 [Chryseobacterium gambrini]
MLSYFEGTLDEMPVKASEMQSLKQGSKEWKEAIKAQQEAVLNRKRFQVKIETKADADASLKDMRDGKGMDRYINHMHKELKYPEGYEVHQAFDRYPELKGNHDGVILQ